MYVCVKTGAVESFTFDWTEQLIITTFQISIITLYFFSLSIFILNHCFTIKETFTKLSLALFESESDFP